jgi:hypothetical protein
MTRVLADERGPAYLADMQSAATDMATQARTMALGYVMQAVSVQMEAPTPDADVLAALDVVVDLLSGKG